MWLNREKTGFEVSLSPSFYTLCLDNFIQVMEPPRVSELSHLYNGDGDYNHHPQAVRGVNEIMPVHVCVAHIK